MNTTTIDQAPTVMRLAQTWTLVQEAPLPPKEFGQLKCLRDRCSSSLTMSSGVGFVVAEWRHRVVDYP